jgi:hypothetical protein
LLAYSQPSDPKILRTQASLASTVWSSYSNLVTPEDNSPSSSESLSAAESVDGNLATLTLELTGGCLYIVEIRPRLLLCLVGKPKSVSLSDLAGSRAESLADEPGPSSVSPGSKQTTARTGHDLQSKDSGSTIVPHSTTQAAANSVAAGPLPVFPSSLRVPLSPRPGSSSSSIFGGGEPGAIGVMKAQGESLAHYLRKELEDFEVPEFM